MGKLDIHSPKQMAALVILVMMAMVLSFVEMPLIATAPWLKYDPSGIIAALAALLYGPWVGSAVAVLAWIPRLMTDPLGAFMNILSSVTLVIAMGLIYRKLPTVRGALLGAVVGIICTTVVSIILNFVVMPLYLDVAFDDILAVIVPALLPFNIVKAIANSGIALIAFRKLETLLAEDNPDEGDRDELEGAVIERESPDK